MADQRQSLPFEPKSSPKVQGQSSQQRRSQQAVRQEAIPKAVANRMARRVAVFTGLPSFAGMGVFVLSYVLMTRGIADIAPGVTLATSGFFFLLGLAGLSYGVLSASWEDDNGTLLGLENVKPNLQRMKESIRAQKQSKS